MTDDQVRAIAAHAVTAATLAIFAFVGIGVFTLPWPWWLRGACISALALLLATIVGGAFKKGNADDRDS